MYDYLAKIILLGPSGSGKYAIWPSPIILAMKFQKVLISPQVLYLTSVFKG